MPEMLELQQESQIDMQMDEEEMQRVVRSSIEDAVQFIEDQLTNEREKSAK